MRECIGLIFFILLLVLWSKVFAHHDVDSDMLSRHSEIKIEKNIQYPLGM